MVDDVVYQPDRGDFIFLSFTPNAGAEQAGRRPALVLSPRDFNIATGLAAVCPITNTATASRFEVPLPKNFKLTGVVLSHQFRSVDWIARDARFHSKASAAVIQDVLSRIEAILMLGQP